MSYNASESTAAMEAKILRMDRLYKDMAGIMMENPHCLDGNPRKEEVIQGILSYLRNKLNRSKSEEVKSNRAMVIRLECLVDCFEEGKNEYAQKVLKMLLEMSVEDLRHATNDLKERAISAVELFFVNY